MTNYQEKHPYSAIYDYYLSQNRNIAEIFAKEGEKSKENGPVLEAFPDLDLGLQCKGLSYPSPLSQPFWPQRQGGLDTRGSWTMSGRNSCLFSAASFSL